MEGFRMRSFRWFLLAIACLFAPVISAAQWGVAPDGTKGRLHVVVEGDTLWDIAKSQGVTPEQIRAWNKIRTTGHIHPGDRLTLWIPDTPLPKGSEPLVETNVYHRVRRGDTLWDIARAYSTSIRELKRLNNIRNASQIKAGDRLQVREASAAVE